jgi:hypothetical protein
LPQTPLPCDVDIHPAYKTICSSSKPKPFQHITMKIFWKIMPHMPKALTPLGLRKDPFDNILKTLASIRTNNT